MIIKAAILHRLKGHEQAYRDAVSMQIAAVDDGFDDR